MILDDAIQVLKTEAEGILGLIDRLNYNFSDCVDIICNSRGRVIVSGIGKSGIIGRKISATLNSTGTKSIFLHPVEAVHGDLGVVCDEDVFMGVSYSGETDELNVLLPSIAEMGCSIIALTGDTRSTLSKFSDVIIDVSVEKEACPLGLAPTTSTTALLAMGDALAVVLIGRKHFKSSDFKKNHPGGILGRRLSSSVYDIMLKGKELPLVKAGSAMDYAVREIDRYGLGVVLVSDDHKRLKGIITDGDLRRLIVQGAALSNLSVDDVMTQNPCSSHPNIPAYDALNIMEEHQITVLPVTDMQNRIKGVLHLHDILGKGAFRFRGA